MNRRGFMWLKVVVALGLFGLMIYTVKIEAIVAAFKSARYELVLLGLLLMPVNVGMQILKWRYLIRLVRPETRYFEALGSLLGGFTFGIVTPGRIGDYSRVLFIPNTPPMKLMGLTVIDKLYNYGCMIAFGLPALMTLPWVLNFFQGRFIIPLMVLVIVADLTLLYFALDPRPVKSLLHALQLMFPRKNQIKQLVGGLDRFAHPQARVTLTLTSIYYMVVLMQHYLFLHAFTQLGFLDTFRITAAVLLTKFALPISIGGLGMDQLVSVQYSGQFAVPAEAAFNASMVLFAINILTPALVGLFFIGRIQIGKENKS